ncbi:hypothetical protein KR009_007508, partial [Drosophila setifemur]
KMQLWLVLALLVPLTRGDVSHLEDAGEEDAQLPQEDPSGFYPSTGLPLPSGYAIPTGANVPQSPVQPPNFPLPIYPPFFGFGEPGMGPGFGSGLGSVPSAYPNGPPTNAALQQAGATAFGAPGGAGFIPNFPPFPGQGALFPGQGSPFPGQGPTLPGQAAPFPGQVSPFPGQGAPFPGQGAPFPGQGAPFPGQGAPYPGQEAPFPGQGAGFPGQGSHFPGQGPPFPPQGAPFPPPDFLFNQGLPLANSQGAPFQPAPGFNVPVGFGGPVPGQFPPGFGGPAPPGYSDEPEKATEKPGVQIVAADDAKSGADTIYATNGGYVYQRAK